MFLGLLLVLGLSAACGGTSPAAAPATVVPGVPALPGATATVAPAPAGVASATAGPDEAAIVRAVGTLDQMRGHLLAAQELAAGGVADRAAEQAAMPGKDLFDLVAGDLAAKGLDARVRGALDRYTAALGQGGAAALAAQKDALAVLAEAADTVAGPARAADPAFRGAVLTTLLQKVAAEYSESIQDGKIANLEPYQSAYGILQQARARFGELQAGAGATPAADMGQAGTALEALRAALPTPAAPAAPAAPDTVAQQVATALAALSRTTGSGAGAAVSSQPLTVARAGVRDALARYASGQPDAAYELAAAAYLDNVEKLEPALLKVDTTLVPALETDFKALRDGIKAGRPQADLEAIGARLDKELAQAAGVLAK